RIEGLVRFSEAISSRVSDWRRYSLRMRLATSGSVLSSAWNDIVTIGAAMARMLASFGRGRAEDVGGRDRALPEDVELRPGEVDDRRGATAVEDRGQPRHLHGVLRRHRRLVAVEVCARGHERAGGAEELERDLVVRHPDAQGAAADRVQDDGERTRPPAFDQSLGAGVDVDPALELRARRDHQDQRHADRAVLHRIDALLRELVVGRGAQAVDRVRRKRDHAAAAHELRRARVALAVGFQDHASTTLSWPPRSRCTCTCANAALAACFTASSIAGSISARTRPPSTRRAGASAMRRTTRAAPPSSAYSAVAGWALTSSRSSAAGST